MADRGTELRQELYGVAFRLDSYPCKHCCLSRCFVAPSVAISLREEATDVAPTWSRVSILVWVELPRTLPQPIAGAVSAVVGERKA